MREEEPSAQAATDEIRVDIGGAELLPQLRKLWEATYDHQVAAGAAGVPAGDRAESWELRRARYGRVFERHPAFVMVARQAKRAVGYVLAYADEPFEDDAEGPVATIENLFVVPELREQGLGGWLLEEAEEEAIEQWGATASAVEVMVGNELAEQFADRTGFIELGQTWLRPAARGVHSLDAEIDDDTLGDLLDEGSDLFALGLEEGPDEMWHTSEVLVACEPETGVAPDGAALEAVLAPFAEAGALSALVALDREAAEEWAVTLEGLGFRPVLRLLTRSIVAD